MAGTPNRQVGAVGGGAPLPAGTTTEGEEDLASRIESGSAFEEVKVENEPTGQAERQEPVQQQAAQEPDRLAAIERRMEEREAEYKQERLQLIGMLNQRQPAPVVVQAPAPAPAVAKPQPMTDDQLIEALNKNPLGTVRSIAAQAAEEAATKVREELGGRVESVRAETAQQAQFRSRLEAEYNGIKSEYADIYGDPKLGPEFDLECGDEIRSMLGQDWQKNFRPTDPRSAADRVYARWLKKGKLAATPVAQNGTAPTNLREIIRQPVTHSDRSTSSAGARTNNGSAVPRTVAELGLTGTEQRAALRVMKDMGLSEATYVANWLAASKDNPNFGKG